MATVAVVMGRSNGLGDHISRSLQLARDKLNIPIGSVPTYETEDQSEACEVTNNDKTCCGTLR
jgi:hypothetical protein